MSWDYAQEVFQKSIKRRYLFESFIFTLLSLNPSSSFSLFNSLHFIVFVCCHPSKLLWERFENVVHLRDGLTGFNLNQITLIVLNVFGKGRYKWCLESMPSSSPSSVPHAERDIVHPSSVHSRLPKMSIISGLMQRRKRKGKRVSINV